VTRPELLSTLRLQCGTGYGAHYRGAAQHFTEAKAKDGAAEEMRPNKFFVLHEVRVRPLVHAHRLQALYSTLQGGVVTVC
jgi:hypothetical protein